MVDQDQVRSLYGTKNINFTLEQFESMAKNRQKLKNYRSELKAISYKLKRSEKGVMQRYIP
jgi:hypothetical protein